MNRYGPRAAVVASLLCTAFVALPASAHDGKNKRIDAKLYEVTENMSLEPNAMAPILRTATAALQGTAKLARRCAPWT